MSVLYLPVINRPYSEKMEILIRLASEITIKSNRVRSRFQKLLGENINTALQGIDHRLDNRWSRFFLHIDNREQMSVLDRVFGIASYSPIETSCRATAKTIANRAVDHYASRVAGKSFAIRARRNGNHPFTSKELEIDLGTQLLKNGRCVDLTSPEIQINIEVRQEKARFFTETIKGLGGLPLASGGRALALLSGGFDSAVAAFSIFKRGVVLDFVFCDLVGSKAQQLAVLRVIDHLLTNYCPVKARIIVVDFVPVVAELQTKIAPKYWQVILKRLFYRTGQRLAERCGALAIVTGEAIGQVSSQTLANLAAINDAITIPVLQPLLTADKDEIIAQAQRIGTYDLCAHIEEHCQLSQARPVTNLTIDQARRQEQKLNLDLIDRQIEQSEEINSSQLAQSVTISSYLSRIDIPNNATVIDCRPVQEYKNNHLPTAQHYEFTRLLNECHTLPKDKTYVIYCDAGLQSMAVAERMQALGYEAYSLKGGFGRNKVPAPAKQI